MTSLEAGFFYFFAWIILCWVLVHEIRRHKIRYGMDPAIHKKNVILVMLIVGLILFGLYQMRNNPDPFNFNRPGLSEQPPGEPPAKQ